jgi:hypothetical protein
VQVAPAGDRIKTSEGSVAVRTPKGEQLVTKGQQADISDTGAITRQLSAPEVTLTLPHGHSAHAGDTAVTNVRQTTVKIQTAVGARIEAYVAQDGRTVWSAPPSQSDAQGTATLPVGLPNTDGGFELSVMATDTSKDRLGSATSQPVHLSIDRTPPSRFALTEPANNATTVSPAHLRGVTEPNAHMTINGSPIIVGSDGNFTADVPVQGGPNVIEFIVTDAAGNSLRVEQTVYLRQ